MTPADAPSPTESAGAGSVSVANNVAPAPACTAGESASLGVFDGLRGTAWSLLLPAVALTLMGVYAVYSAKPNYGKKQLVWLAVALVGFVVASVPHYRRLARTAYLAYGVCLLLLIVVLKTAPRGGAHRWIDIGPASLQPSELAKLAFIVALAEYLRFRENYRQLRGLLMPFVLALLPMGLIVVEPDLGTSLLFLPTLFAMLYAAGARRRHLLMLIVMGVLSLPVMWSVMKDYQRMRVGVLCRQLPDGFRERMRTTFALPDDHILFGAGGIDHRFRTHEGHHLVMSLELIRDGGWLGDDEESSVPPPTAGTTPTEPVTSGTLRQPDPANSARGPPSPVGKLPENHTDFVFVVWAYDTGFLGSVLLLGMMLAVVGAGLRIGLTTPDPFGRLLAVGVSVMMAVQALVNVGMTVGLAPITGITLPFVSYGGSSLLSSYIALGLLANVGRRRPFLLTRPAFEFAEE